MKRAVAGYVYITTFGTKSFGKHGTELHRSFKLDGYVYVQPLKNEKQVFYRYHEDATNDLIAFQPCYAYDVNPPF